MKRSCPNSGCKSSHVVKTGFFHRTSDGRDVQRFQCQDCRKKFSSATGTEAFGQNRRRLNYPIFVMLCSGMSQNRIARVLGTTRTTVARKLAFNALVCARKNAGLLREREPVKHIQFDELETIEHTKCKPLSVALAVEAGTRVIQGFEMSGMPANGPLAHIAREKYGPRPDQRRKGLTALLHRVKDHCAQEIHLLSDMCPRYPPIVQQALGKVPELQVHYRQTKGARGSSGGQGELKKLVFDPLFSLNHTCAMLRANINRLFRRTWCTTKKAECLRQHIGIYAYYHNYVLLHG